MNPFSVLLKYTHMYNVLMENKEVVTLNLRNDLNLNPIVDRTSKRFKCAFTRCQQLKSFYISVN